LFLESLIFESKARAYTPEHILEEHVLVAPLKGRLLGPYSKHLILFLTYEWAQ
jgi:hypothetical protein